MFVDIIKGIGIGLMAFSVFIAIMVMLFKSSSYVIGGLAGYTLYLTYAISIAFVASLLIYVLNSIIPSPLGLAIVTGLILVASYLIGIKAVHIPALIAIYAVGAASSILYLKKGLGCTIGFMSIIMALTALNPIMLKGSGLLHSIIYAVVLLLLAYYFQEIRNTLEKFLGDLKLSRIIKVSMIISLIAVILFASIYMTGIRAYVVVSGSMEPTLNIGDIIIVSPQDTYMTGDIISFHHRSYVITHRIIEIEYSGTNTIFFTKGDANSNPDLYRIRTGEIIGKEVLSIPYLGWLLIILNWNIYVKTLILSISTVALVYLLWKL